MSLLCDGFCFHFGLPEIALTFLEKNTPSLVLLFFQVERSKRFKVLFHSIKLAFLITVTPFRQFPFTTRVDDGETQASKSVSDWSSRVYYRYIETMMMKNLRWSFSRFIFCRKLCRFSSHILSPFFVFCL